MELFLVYCMPFYSLISLGLSCEIFTVTHIFAYIFMYENYRHEFSRVNSSDAIPDSFC